MATVTARALTKQFADTVAVDRLDLDVAGGEFYALLGPSGCGKTTTLRLIAGLELPTGGSLTLGDRDVTNVPPHRRDIGMVFQNYALFPHLDVFGNVAYGLRARRVPKADIGPRVERALERVELGGYGRRRIGALSGGQQQRVAVARAIVLEPSLLLLDEPLSNLDARLRLETRQELRALQRELGITTVYVTHDQEEALTLADTLAVMRAGRIEQVAPPAEVYNRPATAFVAGFIGRANLVPVSVVEVADGVATARLGSGETVRARAGAVTGGPATLCVRPEAIDLSADGVLATVVEVVFNGARLEYRLESTDGQRWETSAPNRGGPPASPGTAVRLSWSPEAALLLG